MAGVWTGVVDRVVIVVAAVLDGVDDPVHDGADDGGVLELVSAGADRHVEPRQGCLVVDRRPVLGDVVDAGDALGSVRDGHVGEASRGAGDLSLIPFHGRVQVGRI